LLRGDLGIRGRCVGLVADATCCKQQQQQDDSGTDLHRRLLLLTMVPDNGHLRADDRKRYPIGGVVWKEVPTRPERLHHGGAP
jgi:hypothetical protein